MKELSEIRAFKVLSAGQNNESSWPVFFIVDSQHCDWNAELMICCFLFFLCLAVVCEQFPKLQHYVR